MKQLITIAFFVISVNCFAQDNLVGTQSPPVVFQGSPGKMPKADFYKGKILVLDFWATWCAPCIAGFPHFNELAKKFGSKDVLFAAITDEPAERARAFFERTQKELDATKLCDTSKQIMNGFKVLFIPYCVVIGKDNTVKWMGLGSNFNEEILRKIINNEPLDPVKPANTIHKPTVVRKPVFHFDIVKSDTVNDGTGISSLRDRTGNYQSLYISKTSIAACLETLTGFGKDTRILTNDTTKISQLINFEFKAGADTSLFSDYKSTIVKNNARNNFIIKLIGESMKFDAFVNSKMIKHYELIITDSVKLKKFRSMQNKHGSFDSDHYPDFEIVGYNLRDMAINLESSFKHIITTNITDNNKYDISLDFSNITTLNKTLAFHGLKLQEVTDNVEFLNVNFK